MKLREYWKPDGNSIDARNEATLKTWMSSNGLDTAAGSVTFFINSKELATLRTKAVKDLKNW